MQSKTAASSKVHPTKWGKRPPHSPEETEGHARDYLVLIDNVGVLLRARSLYLERMAEKDQKQVKEKRRQS